MAQTVSVVIVLLLVAAAGCVPRAPRMRGAEWPAVNVADEKAYPLGPFGGLQHSLRLASSEGRTLRLRGKVHNPYAASVDGVMIVVQILASGPPEGRELERHEIELSNVDLASGDDTAVGRDIQTMYTTTKFIRVAAFAMKRDGTELPPPPPDLGGADVVQLSAMGVPIPNSMVTNFLGGY